MNSQSNAGTVEHARNLFALASMFAFLCAAPSFGQAPKARQSAGGSSSSRGAAPVPVNTLETIRKQAENARQRAINMGKLEAAGEVNKAANEAQSIKERAERMAAREGSTTDGPQADVLRRQAEARAEQLQQEGNLRAARKEQESADKAAEIQRQSDSLQEELLNNQDDQHRGIKLNPVGTNLYIRNYSVVKPNIKPLQAQQQSLPNTNVNGQMASHSVQAAGHSAPAHQSTTQSTRANLKHVTADVKGQLLPKQQP